MCVYCPSLWQASCYLPVPSSMENCNSKIGHFIMKICFPSNIPLRSFILRSSFELDKYHSSISQYQLTCLWSNSQIDHLREEYFWGKASRLYDRILSAFIALWPHDLRFELFLLSWCVPWTQRGSKNPFAHQRKDHVWVSCLQCAGENCLSLPLPRHQANWDSKQSIKAGLIPECQKHMQLN